MSTSIFRVMQHTLPCCHIREYPLATAETSEDVLHLAIKQYIPLDNSNPQPGDLTIIGGHANGFPKELYEPLWDETYKRLKANNIRIRSIWISDVAHQGQSGVLNEDLLGNDPSWFDHPRDLFLMINHFRREMPRPLMGIGHSMGGANLTTLSLMHPRLFTSLMLIDPVLQRIPQPGGNYGPGKMSSVRRDLWPSRTEAKTAFLRSKFYQAWDPRVLDLWVQHGLRELPTKLHPEATPASNTLPAISADPSSATIAPAAEEKQVTLLTTRDQEVLSFMRGNFPTATYPHPENEPDPFTHPDVDLEADYGTPFYRPEPLALFRRLQHLRPSVLYIFGSDSSMSAPDLQREKLDVTGVGFGGSGGEKKGRVKAYTAVGAGHLIPMERVEETADQCSIWIGQEMARWRGEEERVRLMREAIPRERRGRLTEEFVAVVKSDFLTGIKMRGKL